MALVCQAAQTPAKLFNRKSPDQTEAGFLMSNAVLMQPCVHSLARFLSQKGTPARATL